jgi:diguanylate cyclase (GGDEF)-like protein
MLDFDPNFLLGLAAGGVLLLGLMVGWALSSRGYTNRVAHLADQLARAENHAKEQGRMVARMRSEQGTVASLALSLPSVVGELNSRDLDPRRVPGLILNLAEAIFQPGQILFYETRRLPGEEKRGTELFLVASRGLKSPPESVKQIPFGEGKIGWVAQTRLDMLKTAWRNLTRTDGEFVEDNHPMLELDIVGPLVHHGNQDEVLGVLAVGSLGIPPRDEKLMFQMVSNLGSMALVNADYRSRLREQAHHDGLTGLLNKRYFLGERLPTLFYEAHCGAKKLALFIFDIDHFKTYNDTNGHPEGDELLRSLARLLRENLRPGDLCCRYGGEEFVIVMPGTTASAAMEVANRIRETIEVFEFPHQEKQPNGSVTISGGVAIYPEDGEDVAELTRHADEALYESKRGGRNRIARYHGVNIGDVGDDRDLEPSKYHDLGVEN